jgi:hypothetical protein
MSDGQIGHSNVTIPDLLEPVVGFRTFTITKDKGRPSWTERTPRVPPAPFVAPKAYVTDPVSNKLIPDYIKIAAAFKLWQESMVSREIYHPPIPAGKVTLRSPNKEYVWQAGTNEAICGVSADGHTAPGPDCPCGLYSYYDVPRTPMYRPVGIVTSWGQIEAHETGMRSQYMKIELLCGSELAQEVAEQFEIPYVHPTDKFLDVLENLAGEYGSPLPVGMRPKAKSDPFDDSYIFDWWKQYQQRIARNQFGKW